MLQIDRESRIVRWAYLFSDYGPPARTSLCVLFWRTVLITPVKIAGPLAAVGFLLYFFGLFAWQEPKAFALFVSMIAGAVGLGVCGGKWQQHRRRQRSTREYVPKSDTPSVIVDGFRAVKSKVCPLVEIK